MKLGNEYLIVVRPESYEKAKEFINKFLDGEVFIDDEIYYGKRSNDGIEICVSQEEDASTEEEYAKGIWLSFKTNNFEKTKSALIDFKVREVKGGDPKAFFFNFPGGPVFKLIS